MLMVSNHVEFVKRQAEFNRRQYERLLSKSNLQDNTASGVTDILNRVELHTPEQARAVLTTSTLPWIGEQLKQGRELVLEVRLLDDDITDKQRKYLHGVVLTEIAQYARPNDQQFPMPVWKEHFRAEFLGFKVVTSINPLTGRKHRRRQRVSTEDLGIRGMADYIDKCCAWAAEHGITISAPLPPELRPQRKRAKAIENGQFDADTGEILEPA